MYIIRLSLLGAILGNLLVGAAAQTDLPSVTHSGYLSTNKSDNSELFYAYYEAQTDAAPGTSAPVLLWLQVRPDNLCKRDQHSSVVRHGLLYREAQAVPACSVICTSWVLLG